jgi:hypothetical protein
MATKVNEAIVHRFVEEVMNGGTSTLRKISSPPTMSTTTRRLPKSHPAPRASSSSSGCTARPSPISASRRGR